MNPHPSARETQSRDWKPAVLELCKRIERDYQDKVAPFAKGIDVWGNSTTIGFDVRLGSGRSGPVWGTHARYAQRRGFLGILGPRVQTRDLADIESEFRLEIDKWLAEQERKKTEADQARKKSEGSSS